MAADYQNTYELMKALSPLDAKGREEILANPANRALVLNSGANVTMRYTPHLYGIEDTVIFLAERVGKHKEPDGLGALGGLSERTKMSAQHFNELMEGRIDYSRDLLINYAAGHKSSWLIKQIEEIDFDKVRESLNGSTKIEDVEAAFAKHIDHNDRDRLAKSIVFVLGNFFGPVDKLLNKRGKELLLGAKDDIIALPDGKAEILGRIKTIAANTVMREMNEELSEIGLGFFIIDLNRMRLIPNDKIKDDSYILNSTGKGWDGDMSVGPNIYAITPFCHTYELTSKELARIREAKPLAGGYEIGSLKSYPLLEMLERFGKKTDEGKDDLTHNYKYPHEYLAAWHIAGDISSKSLPEIANEKKLVPWDIAEIRFEQKGDKLVEIAENVQKSIAAKGETYKIDFADIAKRMGVEISDINTYLEVPAGTVERMQAAIDKALPSQAINKDGKAVKAVEQVKTVA